MNNIIYSLLLVTSSLLFGDSSEDITINPITHSNYSLKFNYEREYNIMLNSIRQHEGFSSTVYICPAGYKTIGFGHLIKEGEEFTNLDSNSALKLLKNDFNEHLRFAKTLGFEGAQQLAIAHFSFSKGCGNFLNSKLYRLILSNAPKEQIKKEFLKWSYYKSGSKYVFNENMYKNQLYNIQLFFNNYEQ